MATAPGHQARPSWCLPGPAVCPGRLHVAGSAGGSARGPVRGSLMPGVACHEGTVTQGGLHMHGAAVRWCGHSSIRVLVAAQGKQTHLIGSGGGPHGAPRTLRCAVQRCAAHTRSLTRCTSARLAKFGPVAGLRRHNGLSNYHF